jgi:ribosome-associated protein
MPREPEGVRITSTVVIPWRELSFRASRAGGPGGQHVNTSSTRIELWWDAATTSVLDEETTARVLQRLAGRLDSSQRLRVVAAGSRSQLQNRDAAVDRFRELLAEALRIRKPRKKTRPTAGSRERRIKAKKTRGLTKRLRQRPPETE